MESCIVIGFAGGYGEIRVQKFNQTWTVEERFDELCKGDKPWQFIAKYNNPRNALDWIAFNRLGWAA